MINILRRIAIFSSTIFLSMLFTQNTNAEESCDLTSANPISVVINSDQIIRQNVPASLFGFDLDWFQFQNGYYRMGKVRPEIIAWLKPFKGAVYRYGGLNDYEWGNAVKPINNRKRIYAQYEGMAYPEFGPTEFFEFMQKVEGKAVILLNVVGRTNKVSEQISMVSDNLEYLKWLSTKGPRCVGGVDCPISYFELGNEVDFEKSLQWTAPYYSSRVKPLIDEAKLLYPEIKFAVVGRTAPWDDGNQSKGNDFDSIVAGELSSKVDAVTFHSYYDGMSIPTMQAYSAKLVKKYQIFNPHVKVLVTEHGRWPSIPKIGDWSKNWYQASGSGGALSTADFTLMSLTDNNIAGSMWHMLAVRGPWQLFHMNKSNDSVYPSAVYWSLRVLRDALLEDAVEVTPSLMSGKSYVGGYDVRFVAMKDKLRNISMMGVNRDSKSKAVLLKVNGVLFQNAIANISIMQADENGSDSTDAEPNSFQMKKSFFRYSTAKTSIICIPPKSTFSVVIMH